MLKQMIWLEGGLPTRCVLKWTGPWELTAYRHWVPEGLAPPLLGWAGAGRIVALFLQEMDGTLPDWGRPEEAEQVWSAVGELHCRSLTAPERVPARTPRLPLLVRGLEPQRTLPLLRRLVDTEVAVPLRRKARSLLEPRQAALVHGDLHRDNLLRQGRRTILLDWESAALAHPVWDLLFLEPEAEAWEGFPAGEGALRALRAYHESGPLRPLIWGRLLVLLHLAKLLLALLRRTLFSSRAQAAPQPELRALLQAGADREGERAARLEEALLTGAGTGQEP